ncbi:MAG: NAD(P)-binding domain-containing protein [Candidatus Latescibacterota bacterium]
MVWLGRYAHWLHTRWPAGGVEPLPEVGPHGTTTVPGLYVVGDLKGVPLLKFAADSGARAVDHIIADPAFRRSRTADRQGAVLDLAIVGGGVAGMSAALQARQGGLSLVVLEAAEPFATVAGFPRGKPILTYPTDMVPAGLLRLTATVKESLLQELREQSLGQGIQPRRARVQGVRRRDGALEVVLEEGENLRVRRVIVAIGRAGDHRRLGVPGEELDKVCYRLHDPQDYHDREVLVVGGGDSALETALALAQCGGRVTLSYRGEAFSRPKPENVDRVRRLEADPGLAVDVEQPSSPQESASVGAYLEDARRPGRLRVMLQSTVVCIEPDRVVVRSAAGAEEELANEAVFVMAGREPPLDFLRRSGLPVRGQWRVSTWGWLAVALFCVTFVLHWKSKAGIPVQHWFQARGWFPFNLGPGADPSTLAGTLWLSLGQPAFYYSALYSLAVVIFGYRRVRRRQTPYVTVQTVALALVQCLPLFLLPQVLLPWAGHCGWFDPGAPLQPLADALFPASGWAEHGREYWRAVGLVLAWPLFAWNVFAHEPLTAWLAISLVQTFVLIPLLIRRWGKGAYCGWICSCGALAETLGDTQRHKMVHGPRWNRLNMVGQGVLLVALVLLGLRLVGWVLPPDHWVNALYMGIFLGKDTAWQDLPFPLPFLAYAWSVDLAMAGVLGLGLYGHFSGRVWCRFACPLAALMHVYARFTSFRILADKKRCISCNVCTSVCHQGIDVMGFANKGLPMADPQCVRCSACVHACPTGVLEFGRVDRRTGAQVGRDRLAASPVRAREVSSRQT